MENEPNSVFDKLDKQGEKIEDISQKLDGISIEDLYVLAKRTWDCEDYKTAQKYFNHISLLKPLDWEAPLYASLCNFKGPHQVDFWEYALEKVGKVLSSTINYINDLGLSAEEKEKEMSKCLNIIRDYMSATIAMYHKYKEIFDLRIPGFTNKIQSFLVDVYENTSSIELKSLDPFREFIAEECLKLVESTKEVPPSLTKDLFDKFKSLSHNSFDMDYDVVASHKTEATNEMFEDEKKEIKLHGTMYFEYNDKVVSKRIFRRDLTVGLVLIIASIVGIILGLFDKWSWSLLFALPLIYGVLLVIKAITQKDMIKCSSLLCTNRLKNRLTSEGNVVVDSKFNFMKLIAFSILYVVILSFLLSFVFGITSKPLSKFFIPFMILEATNIIAYLVGIKVLVDKQSKYTGKYMYRYKDKYYQLEL